MSPPAVSLSREAWASRLIKYGSRAEFIVPIVILGLVIYLSASASSFLTGRNLENVARQGAPLAILAFGQTVVVLARGFDLSQASTVGLVSVATAKLAVATGSPVALALALPIGLGVGVVNGLLCSVFRMSAIIVTLGMLVFLRGLANIVAQSRPVFGVPAGYDWLAVTNFGPVPISFLVAVAVFLVLFILLRVSTFGLHVYAMGDNPTAARLSGINTTTVLFMTYVLSGLCAGIAGALLTARVNTGQFNLAQGFEIPILTAVFLGGISLTGGVGNLIGVMFAVALIAMLQNGLNLLGVFSFIQQVILGGILLASIILTEFFVRGKSRLGRSRPKEQS